MIKLTLLAALALALSSGAHAGTIAPSIGALVPGTKARVGHVHRNPRSEHCSRKADSVRVRGEARDIYMRKCLKG